MINTHLALHLSPGPGLLSTSLRYITGGRIKEQIVTVEPPIKFKMAPKSGTANPKTTSTKTMHVLTKHLFRENSRIGSIIC